MNFRILLTAIYSIVVILQSFTLFAQTDSTIKLRLQLGAYRNPSLGKFDQIKLNELKGAIYTEDIGNGVKRVFIGDYATPEAAEKALEKIKAMGYDNAYIVDVADQDKAVKQRPAPNQPQDSPPSVQELKQRGVDTTPPVGSDLKKQKVRGESKPPSGGSNDAASTSTSTTTNTTTNTAPPTNPPKPAEKANYVIQLGSFKQINFKAFGNITDLGELTAEKAGESTKMSLGTYTSRTDADRILVIVKQRGYKEAFIKSIPIFEK